MGNEREDCPLVKKSREDMVGSVGSDEDVMGFSDCVQS